GKPIVVCGEGRTVIVTSSYEARAYGIKTGMTLPEARKLCPFVVPVVGNLDKYVDTSLRIHKIMLDFTDLVEVFSIDECFMDVTDVEKFYRGGALEIAQKIKDRMRAELGLTCSVGLAPNKVVAKIAAKLKKPDGLTEVKMADVPAFMEKLSVDQLQGVGIGSKLAYKFKMLGINTAKELGEAPIALLTGNFGIMGHFYKAVGMGKDNSEVRNYYDKTPVKSVGHSHTMAADTYDKAVIKSYLLMLCEKTAARMREYGLLGRTVHLLVRFGDFDFFGKQMTLRHYFNNGSEICGHAWKIFTTSLLPLKGPVRLVGVSVSNLSGGDKQQYLFDDMQKKEMLMETVDEINAKYGQFTVKPAALIIAEEFGILERCGLIGKYLWQDRERAPSGGMRAAAEMKRRPGEGGASQ
ncbi:MAG: hypothetical protein LLG37_06580, partial [Spirochaetia bacterium]|nr:hypothetical protein [Spirochaetia bacterium]